MGSQERERRIRTIPILWLASMRHAMLHNLLEWLLRAPTWDVESVLTWAALFQIADKEQIMGNWIAAMDLRPPAPILLPSKCSACGADLARSFNG